MADTKTSMNCRDIGGKLSVFLRESRNQKQTSHYLEAIVADLAGSNTHLLVPLKELVRQPLFMELVPRAGTGTGSFQRDILLAKLRRTFDPRIIDEMGEVLNGFLDIHGDPARSEPAKPAQVDNSNYHSAYLKWHENRRMLVLLILALTALAVLATMNPKTLCTLFSRCDAGNGGRPSSRGAIQNHSQSESLDNRKGVENLDCDSAIASALAAITGKGVIISSVQRFPTDLPSSPFPGSKSLWIRLDMSGASSVNPAVASLAAKNFMANLGLQSKLAALILKSCEEISVLNFQSFGSDYIIDYYKFPDGEVRGGVCVDDPISTSNGWGYHACP